MTFFPSTKSRAWRIVLVAGTSLIAGMLADAADAGKLSEVRDEVRSGSSSSGGSSGGSHSGGGGYGDCDDDDGSILGDILGGLLHSLLSPRRDSSTPRYCYEEGSFEDGDQVEFEPIVPEIFLAPYPYAEGHVGYIVHSDNLGAPPQAWGGRAWFEYGMRTDGVERWTGQLLVERASGLGLDVNWNTYLEDLGPGLGHDRLDMGELNLLLGFGRKRRAQWRAGVGFNWLDDAVQTDYGWNTTLQLDVYPVQPLIVSGQVDYGQIRHADMFHGAVTAGVIWRRWELFAGYDYRRIGHVDLEGPMFGARVWF